MFEGSSLLRDLGLNTTRVFLLAFTVTYVIYKFFELKKKSPGSLPPGPKGLPFVGVLPYLGRDPRAVFSKYAGEYGDVCTVWLGREPVVFLNKASTVKEAFSKMGHAFSDRPHILFIDYITEGKGIISSSGELWREHRKFSHTVMKDFGMGRSMLEDTVQKSLEHLHYAIMREKGESFDPHKLLLGTVSNVVNSIVFGKSFEYDDPNFLYILDVLEDSFRVLGASGILNFFPFLINLPGDYFGIKKILTTKIKVHNFYSRFCDEHLNTLKAGVTRDFVDAYLNRMMEYEDNDKKTTFSKEQLVQVMGDLFTAGAETTSTTLRWGFAYLLNYPKVQARLQQEIDCVIGSDRHPTLQDRLKMPYTEAYITELQRISDIVPFGVPHAATEDVEFRGYHIPKGTQIWPNLYHIHHNSTDWESPEEFNPDRFIDVNGKFQRPDNVLPFSIGRRVCLGESLARMELFLFTTSILQKFTATPPEGGQLPPLNGILGVSHMPQHFKMRFVART